MTSGSRPDTRESICRPVFGRFAKELMDEWGRWNMGGKLPGLRGGPDRLGCSGGNETDGTGCFSTRVMWRTNGAGEGEGFLLHILLRGRS